MVSLKFQPPSLDFVVIAHSHEHTLNIWSKYLETTIDFGMVCSIKYCNSSK
jgi:hypothetical protein